MQVDMGVRTKSSGEITQLFAKIVTKSRHNKGGEGVGFESLNS